MTELVWLPETAPPQALPPAHTAALEPNGLLAAGGCLNSAWLRHAYRHGIFPWFNPGDPILWWSPDPRAVLWPEELRVSRSLKKSMRNRGYTVKADSSFAAVIGECAALRSDGQGTWITADMQTAYCRLHEEGCAHSFETWRGDELVGGLYGVAIGNVFFGESMFSRATDASKVAFATAVRWLADNGFALVDCQLPSAHLQSLGASLMAREAFLAALDDLCAPERSDESWQGRFAARGA